MKKYLSLLLLGLVTQLSLSAQDFVLTNPVMNPNPGIYPGGTENITFDFYVSGASYTFSSDPLSNDFAVVTFSFSKMNPTSLPPTGTGADLFTWVLTNNGGTGTALIYTWTGKTKTVTMNQSPPAAKYKITFSNIPITYPDNPIYSPIDVRLSGQFTDPGNAPTGNTLNNAAVIATYTGAPTCSGPQLYTDQANLTLSNNFGFFEAGANNFDFWVQGETQKWKAHTDLTAAQYSITNSTLSADPSFTNYVPLGNSFMMVARAPSVNTVAWYLLDTAEKDLSNKQHYFKKGPQGQFSGFFSKVNNGTDPIIRIKVYDAETNQVFGSIDATISGAPGQWTQVILNSIIITGGTDPNFSNTKKLRYDIISLNGVPFSIDNLCSVPPLNGVQPILLLDFTATKQASTVQLDWKTSSEINSDHFEVEWSKDGSSWTNIGNVAAAGNSSTTKSYGLLHSNPVLNGVNYYRLKQVDVGGMSKYSDIKIVTFGGKTGIKILPNPVIDKLYITSDQAIVFKSVSLYSTEGKQLQTLEKFATGSSIDMSRYAAGTYYLRITDAKGNTETHIILKGRTK